MTATEPRSDAPARASRPVRPWASLGVLCLANFLILLDATIVSIALPDVQSTLDAGIDEALWVLDGFLLAFASLLIVAGRVGDLLGPRRVFVGGLALFTLASLLCGLAGTPGELIAARVVQGVGAAALLPQALVLIAATFPPARRGAAFGLFTAVGGVASVSGPTLGGLLVTEVGWRWIFLVNLPLGVAGIVLALRLVPDLRPGGRHRFDPVGVLLATAGLVGLAYALVEGQRHDWGRVAGPVTIPGVLVAAAVLLVLFVLWERRHPEPLVPLGLLTTRNFALATGITLVTSFAIFGMLVVYVLEAQSVLGMSPIRAGLVALPWTLALSAVAPLAGRLTDRIGGRILLAAGLLFCVAGLLGVAVAPDLGSGAGTYALPFVLFGIGTGLTIAPATTEAMRVVPERLTGAASGVLNTARQVGAVLGSAVVGAVLQNRLTGELSAAAAARAGELPPEQRAAFAGGFREAAARGLQLGTAQTGGARIPAGLDAEAAARFGRLVRDVFGQAFFAAAGPTLAVVAAVALVGFLFAAGMTGRGRA